MKPLLLIPSLILFSLHLQAQLFGRQDIGIHHGFMTFHPGILNNDSNHNQKTSWVNEIDRNQTLSRFFSLNYGLGLGVQRNPDKRFAAYENSPFFRLKFGALIHLPQNHSPHNWSPKRLNPYCKVAYDLDIMDQDYARVYGSRLASSLRLAGGMVIRLNHALGLQLEFAHMQRVNSDFRTYFQKSLGLLINLDTPYLRE